MPTPPTADEQTATTPQDVLHRLRAGNARAVSGEPQPRDLVADRAAVADGQHPLAVVVGCIDSRVPPELVFDVGVGELFVSRVAGSVVDDGALAGIEFACELTGVRLVVVLGHTACGAVTGACAGVELGVLTDLLARIRPAVRDVTGEDRPGGDDPAVVDRVATANVRHQVGALPARSDVVARLVEQGDVRIVGAMYDLPSGTVSWLD